MSQDGATFDSGAAVDSGAAFDSGAAVDEGGDERLLGHLNLIEYCRESTRWGIGGSIDEADGILLFAAGTWVPVDCNGAFRIDDGVPAEVFVRRAEAFFAERGRGYTIKVRDGTEADADLRRACLEAGLVAFGEPSPEMVCRRRVPVPGVPSGVEIRRVTTAAGVADFAAVNADAYSTYGMPLEALPELFSRPDRFLCAPHVTAFVAYGDDEPLAAVLTLLSHGIAGVYWVGTVERARGRGLAAAVTATATNLVFDRGARLCTLQASPMGEPVYTRMGYEPVFRYENLVRFTRPKR